MSGQQQMRLDIVNSLSVNACNLLSGQPEFSAYENARHEARFALFHIRFVQAVGERNRKRVHRKPRPEQGALREKQNVVFHLIVLMRVETGNRPPKVD